MMKDKKVNIFEKTDKLSLYFGNLIKEKVEAKSEGEYFSIALSGGSTPKLIFNFLSENFKHKINWEKILVFWGDERCVGPEDDDSNYKMAMDYLLKNVDIPEENIFRIIGEADPEQEAIRYSHLATSKLPLKDGFPVFDLMLLGLGEDGHTASIFQNRLDLFESKDFFDVGIHPVTNQKRITASGTLINFARSIVFITTGNSKADVVSSIISKKDEWEKYPASYVEPIDGELMWLLDKQAASKYLEQKNN